jgi:hypothetical protein
MTARLPDRSGRLRPVVTGELRCYCESPECAAREVVVHVKVYDAPIAPPYRCPLCASELNIHNTLTGEAWRAVQDREGLQAAWWALARAYQREKDPEAEWFLIPAGTLLEAGPALERLCARARAVVTAPPGERDAAVVAVRDELVALELLAHERQEGET